MSPFFAISPPTYPTSPSSIDRNSAIRADIFGSFMPPFATPIPRTLWKMLTALSSERYWSLGPRRIWSFTWTAFLRKKKDPFKCTERSFRKKAVERADKCLRELEVRVDARRAFAMYMRKKQWTIVECSTEADLTIGLECKPDDIIVSRDSDMPMYKSVETIWRPIPKGKPLVYDVPSVYATLLGIVSKNDYSRNILSLGSATNYKIIKELDGEDTATMTKHYLAHSQVMRKNIVQEMLTTSRKVFMDLLQTPVRIGSPPSSSAQAAMTYDSLRKQFGCLSQRCSQMEKEMQGGEKLKTLKTKDLISDGTCTKIDQGIPAIENFVLSSQSSKSYRQTAPLTGTNQPFMSFSERELGILIRQNAALKKKHQELVLVDYQHKDIIPAQCDLTDWLGQKAPGLLITEMLLNVGRREPPKEVDYYLTEVRNIVKTQQDVIDLWGCAPDQTKILGLDLGQAFVVGVSELLPKIGDPRLLYLQLVEKDGHYPWMQDAKPARTNTEARDSSSSSGAARHEQGQGLAGERK
ncbi:hypothetical protein BC939DRAFT_506596 [Gamsiella multidivaricata]|uniref:uncharacterized protein n=1 Tax=Gamsiella multidivaricata TaxID=101098 RepID=UPI002220AD4E|nr:uncharacterized protein BC939DRAFT_506596 [Gamsiella multidivaricata]KAI7818414.1 hypothetical protein BC939DRAFT_506596 [Gamsiella multidivaricata]